MPEDLSFVGRAAELNALAGELTRARGGEVRVVLVEGPAGIGKTVLVRRFLDEAGLSTVRATGDEAELRLRFGVVEQLVGGVADRPPLLADLRSNRSADPLGVGAELLDLVGTLQRDDVLAVVIDDAQWADRPSLEALTFAIRRLQADRILGILVARGGDSLPEGLARLLEGERGQKLSVRGLTSHEIEQLAATVGIPDLPRRAAERLHDHTGGHPLHARTLLEELPPESLRAAEAPLPAPRSFAVLVLARLAACSAETRALVTAAAVAGLHSPLGVTARLAELVDPLPALEEAERTDFLTFSPAGVTPATVSFTHPLVRAAVYDDLGPARRVGLHRRAAALFEGAVALDHRIAASAVEDGALAADVEADGRRLVGEGQLRAAAQRLLAAASLDPDRGRREALVLDAVELLLAAGDAAGAARRREDVAGFANTAKRSYVLGHLAMLAGELAAAEDLLEDGWRRAHAAADARLAARAAGLVAQLVSLQDRFDEGIQWARRALTESDDSTLTSTAVGVLVGVLAGTGRAEEAMAYVAEIDADVSELGPGEIEGLQGRGCARLWTDDFAGARADLSAAVGAGRRNPTSRPSLVALGYLAEAEFHLGAWDDSVVHADLAVSLARDSDQQWLDGFVHAHALWVLAARGDWERAAAHAAAARGRAEPWALGCVAAAAAHLAFCRGEPERVVAAVQPLLAHPQRAGLDEPGVHRWRELYVDALVTLGRFDHAEEILDPFEEQAATRGRRSCLAAIALARGRLAAARGDHDAARAHFETARGHALTLDAPFEQARIDDAYGRFLRRGGDRRAAAGRLGRARDVYVHLGARPFVDAVERELAACGLAPTRRGATDPTKLTPQEFAVARLAASGLRNREVAAELVISVKTVEYHLGHVYSKLGLRSRTELAARFDPGMHD